SNVLYQDRVAHKLDVQKSECVQCLAVHPEDLITCASCYLPGPNYIKPASFLLVGIFLCGMLFWCDRVKFRA
ncbi:MAG TPA: hypothetical protein VJ728_08560, partial [Candidatus Binataceae bacterium]|nr:hypothetical protein [Candidatus Binataceae bacterium]